MLLYYYCMLYHIRLIDRSTWKEKFLNLLLSIVYTYRTNLSKRKVTCFQLMFIVSSLNTTRLVHLSILLSIRVVLKKSKLMHTRQNLRSQTAHLPTHHDTARAKEANESSSITHKNHLVQLLKDIHRATDKKTLRD